MSLKGIKMFFSICRSWMVIKSLIALTGVAFMSTSVFVAIFSTSEFTTKDR